MSYSQDVEAELTGMIIAVVSVGLAATILAWVVSVYVL